MTIPAWLDEWWNDFNAYPMPNRLRDNLLQRMEQEKLEAKLAILDWAAENGAYPDEVDKFKAELTAKKRSSK